MDQTRFDALARSLSSGMTRRGLGRLFGVLSVGGVFASLASQDATGAKKKKPCPPCKKRKKGKCKANLPDGTACENGGTCLSGGCLPASGATDTSSPPSPPPPPPPPSTPPPPPGPCAGKADNSDCNGTGRCLNGVCNPKPTCLARGASCTGNAACCTKACEGGTCDGGVDSEPIGAECQVDADCLSSRCIGYRCVQGTIPVGSACLRDPLCASNQCGCAGPGGTQCTCRTASCGGVGTACNPANALGRDVDCCDGSCTGVNVGTGQDVCA
jgi:hypothetical protein